MSSGVEKYGQPISEDWPSGENLEYDPQFMELERLFRTKPEPSLKGVDKDDAGPDWKGIQRLAGDLLEKTRDLRVQVYSTIASIHSEGLAAFRDNLELLKVFLETFWDTVHPELDPDDDNDPTLRLNTLQMLNQRSLIGLALDRTKLVELKGVGQFGVREVELAQGRETPEENEEVPDIKLIRQAFVVAESETLQNLRTAAEESLELLKELDKVWKAKTGSKEGLSFDNAVGSLKKISDVLEEFSPSPAGEADSDEDSASGEQGGMATNSTAINGRSDIVRLLDRICDYYSVHEPSSPVPLLLRRAQRLVEKSFMEILEDMVPDGLNQAKLVSGQRDDD